VTENTASSAAIAETVKEYILHEFLPDTPASELTTSTPLVSGGVLDSLSTVKLVTFLEERYGIEIEAYETSVDYLDSVDDITRLVQSKL
jgi:acyl carrier protein